MQSSSWRKARALNLAPAQVYAAPLAGGGRAVVLFNRHHPEYPLNNVTVDWAMLGYSGDEKAAVRDLYKRSDLGTHSGEMEETIAQRTHLSPKTRERQGWQ